MQHIVLIQDPDALIRLDMAQTVLELWPDASLILCKDAQQVELALAGGAGPTVMILRHSLPMLRALPLAGKPPLSGARIILTQSEEIEAPAIEAAGWRMLDMPFSAAHLRRALQPGCKDC